MASSILIKNVLLWGKERDIRIEGNRIVEISEPSSGDARSVEAEFVIDGRKKAAIPSLFNAHTHAAMTLFRGYADDLPLHEWLSEKIWPIEARLTEEDVYWGTRLACLEMTKTGTTFFNDMYWHWHGTARAVLESGLRAAISAVFVDFGDPTATEEQKRRNEQLFSAAREFAKRSDGRIIFALGPHAIYTVSEEALCWTRDFAEKNDLLVHIHLAETQAEVEECVKKHGKRPVEFLASLDFLNERVIAAHCVHLSRKEMEILRENDVKIVHNPASNMKLASGVMPYEEMKRAGLRKNILLGTDGCASNNNLDMFEEMKFASLLQKAHTGDPTAMPAHEAFEMATLNAARAFRVDAGDISEGKLADLLLIDLNNESFVPTLNIISNIVFAANGNCVDTVICNGEILMQNRRVKGEEEVRERARAVAAKLFESDERGESEGVRKRESKRVRG